MKRRHIVLFAMIAALMVSAGLLGCQEEPTVTEPESSEMEAVEPESSETEAIEPESEERTSMAEAESTEAQAGDELPPPDGQEVWTYITATSPYTGWEMWPGKAGMYPGQSPHGAYLKLYANDPAIQAASSGQSLPEGSILVKENYGEDQKTLMAITPMYKVEGYNPDAGDWFWAKYGPDGKIMAEGKVDGCINCHRSAEDNNFIFTKAE